MITAHSIASAEAVAGKPARREFRLPLAVRLGSLVAVVILAAVSAFLMAVAVAVFRDNWGLGLVVAAIACFCAALTGYVGRDLGGKWGLRVVLDSDAVTLDLPAARSLIHRPPAQRLTVPYADIEFDRNAARSLWQPRHGDDAADLCAAVP